MGLQALSKLASSTIPASFTSSLEETSISAPSLRDCPICIQSKLTTRRGKSTLAIGEKYLDIIYSDICGPIAPSTNRGTRYIACFIDSKTRYASTFLLARKDALIGIFKDFIKKEENTSNNTLKRLHSDNGLEYKNTAFSSFLRERGAIATFSSRYAHEQNGLAEIFNRTLLNKVSALLLEAKTPTYLQGEAVEAATFLYNRTPHASLGFKTPYEARYSIKPNIKDIRIWGSRAYRKDYNPSSKLAPKALLGCLVGYGSNSWKIYDISSKKTFYSRDCVIIERPSIEQELFPKEDIRDLPLLESETLEGEENSPIENSTASPEDKQLGGENIKELSSPPIGSLVPNITLPGPKDKEDYIVYENLLYTSEGDPESYLEALNSPNKKEWEEAMKLELKELSNQNIWELVPRPSNRQVLKGRWVYKQKTNHLGEITRFKARQVCKGFQQKYGLDYLDTWANTIRPSIYRALFGIASSLGLEIFQQDIKLAFIHSPIQEEIYVEEPTGFSSNKGALVCRLNKALYGLKQAPRAWQQYLGEILVKLGFKNLGDIDPSLYLRDSIIIGSHVDDLLVLGPNKDSIISLRKELEKHLLVQDLGEVHYYLGIEIIRNPKEIILTQQGFITKVLNRFKLNDLVEYSTPLPQGIILSSPREGEKASLDDTRLYQQQIGSLMYLMTQTRPDISYPLGLLARFMSNPTKEHFLALNRLWGYLKRTKNYGLVFKSQPISLVGYCDSDWGGDRDTRRSTTGYLFLLGNTPISWASKLQKTVALSSCKAKYIALKEAIKEQSYLKTIFNLIPILAPTYSTRLYTDSQSAIALAKNPIYLPRTKHIDIQYHYIREALINKDTDLVFTPTSQ